jgi:hypothetical protein
MIESTSGIAISQCVWQLYSAHFGSLFWPTSKLLILR